jgi:hypothetical protein
MEGGIPPVVRIAERLMFEVTQAVQQFARFHRHGFGSDLSKQVVQVARLCHRAWRDRLGRRSWLKQLRFAVDDLKLSMQLGCQLRAFRSNRQFEHLFRIADDLGRQVGGWFRYQQHPKGQSAPADTAPAQRAMTLSTRAASKEAS